MKHESMLIGGAWVGGNQRIEVSDPATTELVGSVPSGTAHSADAAVLAAKNAFADWRYVSANQRAELLHEAAHLTHLHFDDLVTLLTREQGKPKVEQAEEFEWAANVCRYYAELARNGRGKMLPSSEPRNQLNFTIREPYGVVAAILPWNYPIMLLSWKIAPALAAGNTVVIKPSELTPLSTIEWIRRCFSHFPVGVVNIVTGCGDVGEALVRHPDVRVVAFTGSLETGQRIASLAAPQMKHLHLELGGKDAFVVGPDADIGKAADALAYAGLINAGQVCTSSERVYVPRHSLDEFAEALVAKVSTVRLGHGLDDGVDMGPMIGERYRTKVEAQLAQAVAQGARVLFGGQRPAMPARLARGWFLQPTVLVNVHHGMRIASEETFGPVLPLMVYDSIDEMIGLVNDSPFGLGACLRTGDTRLAKRFFDEVKAGTIWINDPLTDNYAGPFGGMKYTGGGRELGEDGLNTFLETKHVHWDLSDERKSWWYPY